MSAFALVIGLVLAGQVNSANERYPISGGRQAEATNGANSSATSPGLVPPLDSSAKGTSSTVNPAAPRTDGTDPYSGQTSQPAAGNQRSFPLGTPSSPPSAAGSTPPPIREFQAPPNSSPSNSVPAQPAIGLMPTAMMRAMLTAPGNSQLSGVPLPLVKVLSGATSRPEETQREEAYWDLCSSVADYYLGLREQEELRRLRSLSPGGGTPWQQFEDELNVRMDTSLRAARPARAQCLRVRKTNKDNPCG